MSVKIIVPDISKTISFMNKLHEKKKCVPCSFKGERNDGLIFYVT